MKGQIDFVIVYKMSRASRDVESYIMSIRSVLASRGIKVRSATEPFDDSPMGRFVETLYVSVAQLDNDTKRDMVVDNMRRIAQQGYWQHKPIRGYNMATIKNAEGQPRPSMLPNEEADKVTDVLLRFNKGDITEARLVRYSYKKGIKDHKGRPLSQETLHKMLIRPEYAGYVHDKFTNFELVEGKHPGLISREVFEENQHIIKSKNKEYLLGVKHNNNNDVYPLRRFMLCVSCLKPMTACAPSDSPRYFCARPSCRGTGSIMASVIHTKFEAYLKQIELQPETVKRMKEIIKHQAMGELKNINQEIANLRGKLNKIADIRAKALQQFISGKISEDDKQVVIDNLDNEKLEVTQELERLEQQQTLGESSIEYALTYMTNIAKLWSDADLDLKRKLQNLVFPKGFTYDIKQGNFISPGISPLYRYSTTELTSLNSQNSIMVTSRGIEPLLPG
jgi:site-specific DNA recombinase